MVVVGAFSAEGRWFDSLFSRHADTLGKSFSRNCLYDLMWRPVASMRLKFESSDSLLSSVHTFLVNILRCVRLCIKRKYYIHLFIYSFIHSFIYFNHFYSAPSSPLLLRGAQTTARILYRSFTRKRTATVGKGLAQGPYIERESNPRPSG